MFAICRCYFEIASTISLLIPIINWYITYIFGACRDFAYSLGHVHIHYSEKTFFTHISAALKGKRGERFPIDTIRRKRKRKIEKGKREKEEEKPLMELLIYTNSTLAIDCLSTTSIS